MISLAEAAVLAPHRPSPERILRTLFGDYTRYAIDSWARRFLGSIGSIEVTAIAQPMWQQGPLVIPLLDVSGLLLVWAPRIDDPDAGPTVLTDLAGWILPPEPPDTAELREPTMPDGAIRVALGPYLARELADLAVDGDLSRPIALLELLARQTGQGSGSLGFATVSPLGGTAPSLPPVADLVADVAMTCDHHADRDYNAGGYDRVISACRLAIGCERWAFVREPRTIEREHGIALS